MSQRYLRLFSEVALNIFSSSQLLFLNNMGSLNYSKIKNHYSSPYMSTPIFPFELYLILENPVHLQSQSPQSKLTFRKNRFQKCSILENSRNFSFPESRNREALGSRSKTFRPEGDPRESNRMYRIKTDRKKKHRTRAIPRTRVKQRQGGFR